MLSFPITSTQLRRLLSQQACSDCDLISTDSRLKEDLGLDSLDFLEYSNRISDEIILLPDDALDNVKTFGEVFTVVEGALRAKDLIKPEEVIDDGMCERQEKESDETRNEGEVVQ